MLILNESKFNKLVDQNPSLMENAFVYVMSHTVKLGEEGSNQLSPLIPTEESIKDFTGGEITKREFKKAYKKQLNEYTNSFLLYTIARSFNEKKYMPIFVCSDEEFELGYLQILTGILKKKYGMKAIKVKQYLKELRQIKKDTKKIKGKKKRNKARVKMLRDVVRDNCQMSLDGLEYLEKQDQKFAIDRIAILINQSDDPSDEIPKKSILESLNTFSKGGKKAAKLVKQQVKELDLSKKSDRWSKKDAIKLVLAVYNEIHDVQDDD